MEKSATQERYMEKHEIQKLFRALNDSASQTARDFFFMQLFTGSRVSDLISLKWSNINFRTKRWKRANEKKLGVSYPLMEQAMHILQEQSKERQKGLVFFDRTRSKLRKGWSDILKRANIAPLTVLDLRRSTATHAYLDHKLKKEQGA